MRVLVCGGRDYTDRAHVDNVLDAVSRLRGYALGIDTLIHGDARGADGLADAWARAVGTNIERFPAEWTKHGKAAGPLRNQRMLDEGKPDIVVAFPGGRGTEDMVQRARAAGVPVILAERKGWDW